MLDKKTLEELRRSVKKLESIERGDHIGQIRYEDMEDNLISRMEQELKKLNQDFDKYCADNAAYQAAQEKSQKLAEKRQFWYGILSNIISAIIGGLVVYYWPSIVSFFTNLFQK